MDKKLLLQVVEAALISKKLTPSAFGRAVNGDPNLVIDLRAGREPRQATRERILEFVNGAAAQ